VLATRVVVGVIFIPIILLLTATGGIIFTLFITAIAGFASREFFRMFLTKGRSPSVTLGFVGSICVCFSFHFGSGQWTPLVLTVFVLIILVERLIRQDREAYAVNVGTTVLGVLYTGWLLGFFILLREIGYSSGLTSADTDPIGRNLVYLVLAVTWSYDTIAYVAGTFFGRRRIFSRISPSKTVEGTLAGLAAAIAAAMISSATFATFLGIWQAVALGVALGIVAQAGDLVESIMKRSAETKDSSHIIPGHGGVLDRFDSLIFTGPTAYLCFTAMIARGWL
jgi:phosphatidate cytidylyltransferase